MKTQATLFALLLAMLLPVSATAGVAKDQKSGQAKLQEANTLDDHKHQVVQFEADGVKLKISLYYKNYYGRMSIIGDVNQHNTNKKTKHYQLSIAFYDEKGKLLGCTYLTSGGEGLEGGAKRPGTSGSIPLDPADIKKVKSYQAVLHVGDKSIGTP